MRNWKCLNCNYLWTSKKTIGKPSKCPNCNSVNIKVIPLIEGEIYDYAEEIEDLSLEILGYIELDEQELHNFVKNKCPKINSQLNRTELEKICHIIGEKHKSFGDDLIRGDVDKYLKKGYLNGMLLTFFLGISYFTYFKGMRTTYQIFLYYFTLIFGFISSFALNNDFLLGLILLISLIDGVYLTWRYNKNIGEKQEEQNDEENDEYPEF